MELLGNRHGRDGEANLGLHDDILEEPLLPPRLQGAPGNANGPEIAVGEVGQAAPDAVAVAESVRLRSRLQWDKYLDMLLRLPLLFLMDQILLQDMGINYFTRSNYTSQAINLEGSAPGYSNSNSVEFHFNNDPNFTIKKNAFLKAKHDEVAQKFQQTGNSSTTDPLLMSPQVEATATEIYQSLYGNPDWAVFPHMAYCLAMVYAYLIALFVVLMLNTRQLKTFYTYLICASFLPISYLINAITITQLSSSDHMESISEVNILPSILNRSIIVNYLAQAGIGYLLTTLLRHHLNNNAHWLVNDLLPFSMLFPSILTIVGLEPNTLRIVALMSILPPAVITIASLWHGLGSAFRSIRHSFENKRQILRHFGLNTLLEAEWVRLHVPSLLRTFWLTRCVQQLLVSFIKLIGASGLTPLLVLPTLNNIVVALTNTAKELLTRGNETTIAVLGMTSIVSALCHHIGSMFHFILTQNSNGIGGAENDEEKSVASVSAVLFFVLALQTGLTSLEPDKRFARLCKNLCLLVTALFHFVHNMVSPVLMSLSAARVVNYRRHFRALSICVFLTCAPLTLMTVLWKLFPIGTWLLAVSAFCVEVVVKVLVTVAVYALFLYDSKVREGAWEGLDDAVYYVRAAGNTVEFCFAVFLFFNGGWILLFESGGTIRALMMLIHAYCNIWCEARSGWATFVKRRSAVAKIDALPDATAEQLSQNDDVCAICYQEMEPTGGAKVTRCNHYFHGSCLRKWLYVQDSCPLCHGALYNIKDIKESRANAEVNNAQVIAQNDGNEGIIDNDFAMERPIDDGEENNSQTDVDNNDSDSEVDMADDMDELAEDTETSQDADEEADQNSTSSCSCSDDDDDDLLYDSMEDYRRGIHSKGDAQSSIKTFHSQPQSDAGTSNTDASSSGAGDISKKVISNLPKGPSQLKNSEQIDHSGTLPFSKELGNVGNDSLRLPFASPQSDDSQKQAEVNHSDTNT